MTERTFVGQPLVLPRAAVVLLLVALAANLVWHAIVPALSRLDTDFPNYLTAAKIVADRRDVERLYDNSWFQDQMRRYHIGKPSEGKFAPFPPPTALLLVPLARMTPLDALRVMTCLSALCLTGSIVLLSRIFAWGIAESAVYVLLSGVAAINAVRLGQPYILVSLSCILGYYAYLNGRALSAGLCFGLFVPIKYFPLVFLIYFAFRREWRVVLGGAVAILAVALLSVGVLGWRVHQEYVASILGPHLVANLSMQDPFTASFQSFDTLFRRLFVYDATSNPHPMIALPELRWVCVLTTKVVIFCTALVTLVRLARREPEDAIAPAIGILGILVLLLAPATATYHFVLLWLPIGLLVNFFLRERAWAFAYLILGIYAFIGFFPYRFSVHFEGHGALTVLAYPRLFLLLAIFSACVYFVWCRKQATA